MDLNAMWDQFEASQAGQESRLGLTGALRDHRGLAHPNLAAITGPVREYMESPRGVVPDMILGGTVRYLDKFAKGEQMDTMDYVAPAMELPGVVAGKLVRGAVRGGEAVARGLRSAIDAPVDLGRRDALKKMGGGAAIGTAATVVPGLGAKIVKELAPKVAKEAGEAVASKTLLPAAEVLRNGWRTYGMGFGGSTHLSDIYGVLADTYWRKNIDAPLPKHLDDAFSGRNMEFDGYGNEFLRPDAVEPAIEAVARDPNFGEAVTRSMKSARDQIIEKNPERLIDDTNFVRPGFGGDTGERHVRAVQAELGPKLKQLRQAVADEDASAVRQILDDLDIQMISPEYDIAYTTRNGDSSVEVVGDARETLMRAADYANYKTLMDTPEVAEYVARSTSNKSRREILGMK